MVKVRVDLALTEQEQQVLVQLAGSRGYKREDPRKAWTETEYKDAVRNYTMHLVAEAIYKHQCWLDSMN